MTLLQCTKIYYNANVYKCVQNFSKQEYCVFHNECVHVITQTNMVDVRFSKETNFWLYYRYAFYC